MKKRIVLILLLTFFVKSHAQDKKINFQLSIGPTISIPKTSELSDSDSQGSPVVKSSINVGGYILPSFNYSFNRDISLDFGAGFYLDRFSIEDKIGPLTNKGNRNVCQIQTPVNVNFHLGKNKSYLLGVGGFLNFIVAANEKGESTTNFSLLNFQDASNSFIANSTYDYNTDIRGKYNSLSFGAFIQLKKNISFSTTRKGFVLVKINQYVNAVKDYNRSLSSIYNPNEKESTTVNVGVGIEL